ncbi:hypothetical protein HanPSC8_Chr09g0350801 [Helianthus annuus]|nr:hypothetical protein HanPSC8_Chr09g0350801 [Helianthus annuus]
MSTTTILHHTTTFLHQTLSQADHHHRIFTLLLTTLSPPLHPIITHLNLAQQTLENAITTTNSSLKSSSLRLSETLLLSHPKNPVTSFLLSLIYTLCDKHVEACISLLELFETHPSIARTEVAPQVFEEMFLVHFVPVLEWYNEKRLRIVSSLSSNDNDDDDNDESEENSVVVDSGVSCVNLLSKMNGDQALELKELERDYEEVLDENCRVFVGYFKEVLENKDADRVIDPPDVVLEAVRKGGNDEYSRDGKSLSAEFGSENGRYNVMFVF